ncbi:MAG: hypothetical protein IJX62_07375 [Clostridia bacterium]|nr:hypothetical protein [Clostridia bacterium]
MTDGRFDYLEDGQIAPTVALWQKRLKEDPPSALSVFRTLRHRAGLGEALLQRLREVRERMLSLLDGLLCGANAAMARIPRPQGFFTTPQDRAEALRQLGLFMTASEIGVAGLQSELLPLEAAESDLRERQRRALLAEEHLRIGGQVATEQADAETAEMVCGLLQELLAENQRTDGLAEELLILQGAVRQLCQEQWPAFCVRGANASDMTNDGQDCRVPEVLRICDEWKNALLACRARIESAMAVPQDQSDKT